MKCGALIMLEIFQGFESALGGPTKLSPVVLIAPGLAAIVVGLFFWLGGSGVRRPLVALIAAIVGGICGFLLTGRNIIYAAVSAAATALVAALLQRVLIAILVAALAAIIGFAILAGPRVEAADEPAPASAPETPEQASTVDIGQSIERVRTHAVQVANNIKQLCSQMPVYKWVIIAVLAVVFMAAGFWLWRFASALCFATIGTTLIFSGLILLLLYKGSAPISKICNKAPFYQAVFAGMAAFGTFVQLLFFGRPRAEAPRKKETAKSEQEAERTKYSWRNR
jgi:hypothetical protein